MAGAGLVYHCLRATFDWCRDSPLYLILQYVRQELMEAGMGHEHADAFLSNLRRSTLARPDAGLAEFRELVRLLQIGEEEVCFQVR